MIEFLRWRNARGAPRHVNACDSDPDIPFKRGDLVTKTIEPPGFEGTVYTVAGLYPDYGWVKLQQYANPLDWTGLNPAPDATSPSSRFPRALPDPGMTNRVGDVEHALPDGGVVAHRDDAFGRVFCSVCGKTPKSDKPRPERSQTHPDERQQRLF